MTRCQDLRSWGELGLNGSITPVAGVLSAAIGANARGEGLICPAAYGPKRHGRAPKSRSSRLHRSFNSRTTSRARGRCHGRSPKSSKPREPRPILRHPGPGERQAALDVPAAGGHNLLTVGPPGVGKSMLASRLPDPAAAGRPNSSKSPWSPPSPVSFEGGALTHRFSLSREAANAMRLSARGYHRVLLVARTLPSSAVGDVDRPAHADRGKKFMPRLGVVPEHTQHAARDHADAGLVDAAGGHALMRRLGDDGDAVRL